MQYPGVIIDSEAMTVTFTPHRVNSLKSRCQTLLHKTWVTVREAAHVIGKIVASFSAVKYGPLHYRKGQN